MSVAHAKETRMESVRSIGVLLTSPANAFYLAGKIKFGFAPKGKEEIVDLLVERAKMLVEKAGIRIEKGEASIMNRMLLARAIGCYEEAARLAIDVSEKAGIHETVAKLCTVRLPEKAYKNYMDAEYYFRVAGMVEKSDECIRLAKQDANLVLIKVEAELEKLEGKMKDFLGGGSIPESSVAATLKFERIRRNIEGKRKEVEEWKVNAGTIEA